MKKERSSSLRSYICRNRNLGSFKCALLHLFKEKAAVLRSLTALISFTDVEKVEVSYKHRERKVNYWNVPNLFPLNAKSPSLLLLWIENAHTRRTDFFAGKEMCTGFILRGRGSREMSSVCKRWISHVVSAETNCSQRGYLFHSQHSEFLNTVQQIESVCTQARTYIRCMLSLSLSLHNCDHKFRVAGPAPRCDLARSSITKSLTTKVHHLLRLIGVCAQGDIAPNKQDLD